MNNTSATGGYLRPYTELIYGDELQNFLHEAWVGITGLEKTRIRPMWQPFDPVMPNKDVPCWMCWGIVGINSDQFAFQEEADTEDHINYERQEILQLAATFQGQCSMDYAALFRDGLRIAQNMEVLQKNGMTVQEVGDLQHEPDLYNTLWYSKTSIGFTISRGIRRKYRIVSILETDIEINFRTDN